MAEGRKVGVAVVQLMRETLTANAGPDFPGISAWLGGAGKVYNDLNKDKPTDDWRRLNAEMLVTGNPAFWQMYYEVEPGDVGLFTLHAGALLAAGDAHRCDYVLRMLFHAGKIDSSHGKVFMDLFQHSAKFKEASTELVSAGIKQHDAQDYNAAVATFMKALLLWPQNGFAHYEMGHTLRAMSGKVDQFDAVVVKSFAQARRYQPMLMAGWQGSKKLVPGMEAMHTAVIPYWENSLKSLDYQMKDADLEAFAKALQEAEVDDLALVSRQVLIHRRGRYLPADQPFIATSLRRMVPGPETEATLKRLSAEPLMMTRLSIPGAAAGPQK